MIRFIGAAIPLILGLLLFLFVLGVVIRIIYGIASYIASFIGGVFATIVGLVIFYFVASFLLNACDIITAIVTSSLEGY